MDEIEELQQIIETSRKLREVMQSEGWQVILEFIDAKVRLSYEALLQHEKSRPVTPDYMSDDMYKGYLRAFVDLSDSLSSMVSEGDSAVEELKQLQNDTPYV